MQARGLLFTPSDIIPKRNDISLRNTPKNESTTEDSEDLKYNIIIICTWIAFSST